MAQLICTSFFSNHLRLERSNLIQEYLQEFSLPCFLYLLKHLKTKAPLICFLVFQSTLNLLLYFQLQDVTEYYHPDLVHLDQHLILSMPIHFLDVDL